MMFLINGFIISDIDECMMNMDNCDNQTTFCFNVFGIFDCLCLFGYINPNGTSCQRKLNLICLSFTHFSSSSAVL